MDSDNIIAVLDHSFEDKGVQSLVKQLGMKGVPEAKPKEPRAYLEAKPAGVQFAFTDADYLEARKVARYGNADMILTGATLYALNGEPGYKAFKGQLPKGALLSDTPAQLTAKLGPPALVDEREGIVRTQSWKMKAFRLTFSYDAQGAAKYVQIILPKYLDRLLK